MEEIGPMIALGALVVKLVDFFKFAAIRDVKGITTQAGAWAAGVVAVFLFGASQFGDMVVPGTGLALGDMNGWTKLIVGLSTSSFFSTVTDFRPKKGELLVTSAGSVSTVRSSPEPSTVVVNNVTEAHSDGPAS